MSPDEPSDVRRRRAERSRTGAWREGARRAGKPLAILAAVLLLATVVWAASQLKGFNLAKPPPEEDEEDMRHWHAGFKVYIDGRELDLHKCQFDLDGCGGYDGTHYVPGHLHFDDRTRYMLHIEHPLKLGNVTLWHFLDRTGFELTNTSLQLEDRVYDRELYENNETHEWQLWIQHCVTKPPTWERETILTDYIPLQHDRFLLTFTRKDRPFEELAPQYEAVPTSDQMYDEDGGQCPRIVGTITSTPA